MSNCVDCNSPDSPPSPAIARSRDTPPRGQLRKFYRLPDTPPSHAIYDDCGFYIVVPQEANNLLTNPTFYVGLDGWSAFNSKISRSNNIAFDSGFSLRLSGSGDIVTAERREYAESEINGFLAGQTYTFSMRVWFPTRWDVVDPQMFTISIVDDDGITTQEVFSDQATKAGRWEELEVTKFIRADATNVYVRVNLRSQDQQEIDRPHDPTGFFNLANEYAYFDMGQFELGTEATTPFHGSTSVCGVGGGGGSCSGNYSWLGEPHNSASHRSACARDGGKLVCLRDLGFDITNHNGHGHPPLRDISFPLTNRSGEYYEKTVADARVLTLTGQLCAKSLEELECEIYELGLSLFPSIGGCGCGEKLLLVYRHEDCLGNCDVDRDFAICVTYLGGLEGNRTNHFIQNAALQFKAHDPFWFEWPGNKSQALNFTSVVTQKSLIKIETDGSVTGFPVDPTNDYTSVACLPGADRFVLAGDFDDPGGSSQNCAETGDCCVSGIAVWDCDDWCCDDPTMSIAGGTIRELVRDNSGNVLAVGSFVAPCQNVMIVFADGNFGCFIGYPGGEAYSVEAPFWAQVAVGAEDGIYIQDSSGNWLSYSSDGPIYDLALDSSGNLYAAGDFTTIDGQSISNVARFNVNTQGCLDAENGTWESIGHTFNGAILSLDFDPNTGRLYLGGEATEATPNSVEICETSNATQIDSNGSNQQIRFTQVVGNTYQVEFYFTNIIARSNAVQAFTDGDAMRVVGTSSVGTNYNFLFGQHNSALAGVSNPIVGTDTFYAVVFQIELDTDTPEPCLSLNTALDTEFQETYDTIEVYTPLGLPGGIGIDDTLSNLGSQRVTIDTSFDYDPVTINHVASFSGGDVQAMGDGLPGIVHKVVANPSNGEVWAAMFNGGGTYTDGLAIWSGSYWGSFPGDLGGSGDNEVIDISFCPDSCSVYVLFEGTGSSLLPGRTEISYNGTVSPTHMQLVVHGPGKVEFIEHHDCDAKIRACTEVQCDEIAVMDFSSGKYFSNYRSNLAGSVFGGSRLSGFGLDDCKDNPISLLITGDTAETKATLIYRESHMGIEALCCRQTEIPTEITSCVNKEGYNMHRDPTETDCEEQGWSPGDVWTNTFNTCPSMFLFKGGCDNYCETCAGGLISGDCEFILDSEGNCICPDCHENVLIDNECNDLHDGSINENELCPE